MNYTGGSLSAWLEDRTVTSLSSIRVKSANYWDWSMTKIVLDFFDFVYAKTPDASRKRSYATITSIDRTDCISILNSLQENTI